MRDKKKPLRRKQKIREQKKKRVALAVATLIAVIFISTFLSNSISNQPSTSQTVNSTSEPKAAVIDQLSLMYPNQMFIQTVTNTLKQAGYTVDYYPGENVTVEFYRNLPSHGYKLMILRVHSSATESQGTEWPVTFFTSERFDKTKYIFEQLTDQLGGVAYSNEEVERGIVYFGIGPVFVTKSMKGRFQDSIVLMMGCEGLDNPLMAKAFVEKGAKVYISWNQQVLVSHTDLAATHLLQHFLIEKGTIKHAIQETYKEVGADPVYNSLLIAYPIEALDYRIQDIVGNFVTGSVEVQHKSHWEKREI